MYAKIRWAPWAVALCACVLMMVPASDARASGTLLWAFGMGGSGPDDAYDVAPLPDGGVVVTGYFSETATFAPGVTLTSAGGTDIFVARFNPDGTLAWVRQAGGTGPDQGTGVTVVPGTAIVVTGSFSDTATFASGVWVTAAGSLDAFVAWYDPDGDLQRVRQAGGPGDDVGIDAAVHPDGLVTVTGYFMDTASFATGTAITSEGGKDIFVARYTADGELEWVDGMGGLQEDAGTDVVILPGGEALVTGFFTDTAAFGPVSNDVPPLPDIAIIGEGGKDGVAVRCRQDGTVASLVHAGGPDDDEFSGIAAMPYGVFYVTGYFEASATFGPSAGGLPDVLVTSLGGRDLFLARYNAAEELLWVETLGTPDDGWGLGVAALPDASAVIAGYVPFTYSSGTSRDIMVARFSADGVLAWIKRAEGSEDDSATAVTVVPDGDAVAVGFFEDLVAFGVGEGGETFLTAEGSWDAFVARYSTGVTNGAPSAGERGFSTTIDAPLSDTLTASDPDPGNSLEFFLVEPPSLGTLTLDPLTGAFVYTPDPGIAGTDTFRYLVSDGAAYSTAATITIVIDTPPVADASLTPATAISPNNQDADVLLDGSRSSDADGDPLTYTWYADGDMTTPIATGMQAEVTLAVGAHTVTLVVSDGIADDSDTLTVTVLTAGQAVRELAAMKDALSLPAGAETALDASLDAAAAAFDRGNMTAGVNALRAFQRQVRAQTGKMLDAATADLLTSAAQSIIDAVAGADAGVGNRLLTTGGPRVTLRHRMSR